jgi:TetR/AcrR family transcriptional regulator, transcriptional repressor for nem operon
MRYGADHKDRTRGKLLKAAAEQIRLHGPDGVSVAGVMKRAGLTHGGFYAHFDSKDALIEASIEAMFEHAAQNRAKAMPGGFTLAAFIDTYISAVHRDHPGRGCPIPSLMSESRRWPKAAREAFDRGISRMADRFANYLPESIPDRRAAAMSVIAEMAGAISLSRAISDPSLSDALLEASRDSLRRRYVTESASPSERRHDH